jgi:UDP-2,4-diacetamido-2,4,6-trideoxy-beta-L-altropyranose hydrolase
LSAAETTITLRPASMGDLETVFRWRNDPFILAHGSSHREVDWEEHQKWFAETISSNRRLMFIVLEEGKAIGQIRFERQNQQDCVVSVYLLQEFTGLGYGLQAIRIGCAAIYQAWDVDRVVACVRFDNPAGRFVFLKSGFSETGALSSCPAEHHSLVLSRGSRPK